MPAGPPLAWPEPPPPALPTPPASPAGPWAPLAVAVGAVLVVALVVALVAVARVGDATASPSDGAARVDASVAPTRPPASTSPPATVPPPTSSPGPTPGSPVDLAPDQLQAALLTELDLRMTETVGAPPDTTDTIPVGDFDADVACKEMLRRYDAIGFRPLFGGGPPRAPRRARVELARPGETVEHEVGDGLQVTVADIRDLFETCTEISFTTAGRSDTLSIRQAGTIPAGDDSLSLQYTFAGDGPDVPPVLWVIWERNSIISSVSLSGGRDPDQTLLDEAVRIADRRLEDIIG